MKWSWAGKNMEKVFAQKTVLAVFHITTIMENR